MQNTQGSVEISEQVTHLKTPNSMLRNASKQEGVFYSTRKNVARLILVSKMVSK